MSIKIADLRRVGDHLYRDGMAEMAIKEVDNFDGSYKGVMELCGKLSVIAKMATCDYYWNEQVCRGYDKQEFEVEKILSGLEKARGE